MTVPDPITLGHTTSGGLYDECGGCHRAGAVLARLLDLAEEAKRSRHVVDRAFLGDEVIRLVRREEEQ